VIKLKLLYRISTVAQYVHVLRESSGSRVTMMKSCITSIYSEISDGPSHLTLVHSIGNAKSSDTSARYLVAQFMMMAG
jgi:hypothetical protein